MKNFYLLMVLSFPVFLISQTDLKVTEFKNSQVISTNFTVPLVRFNFVEETAGSMEKGNVTFFSSVGAGVSYNFGRLFQYENNDGEIVENQFMNIIGLQVGFLFSAETADPPTNLFAITSGINILDFHVGYGYELGTIAENQKRGFITIAYSIPVSKLTKAGLFVRKRGTKADKAKDTSTF